MGFKLHLLGARCKQALPISQQVGFTSVCVYDLLNAFHAFCLNCIIKLESWPVKFTRGALNQQLPEQGTTIITLLK